MAFAYSGGKGDAFVYRVFLGADKHCMKEVGPTEVTSAGILNSGLVVLSAFGILLDEKAIKKFQRPLYQIDRCGGLPNCRFDA